MHSRSRASVAKTSALLICLCVQVSAFGTHTTHRRPLMVFILAGQSNMQGHANVSTMDSMAADPKTAAILKDMRDANGKPVVCDRVWISSVGCAGDGWSDVIEQTGKLTAGFGASPSEIGPEFTFGLYTAKALRQPVLIIKTSWGGRSLMTDFRPPSAGPRVYGDGIRARWKQRGLDPDKEAAKTDAQCGVFYRHMIDHIKMALGDIKRIVPDYDPKQGYKLGGFVWFQGFNDMIDDWSYPGRMQPGGYADYSRLLEDLIRDVRNDLSAPKLPFVIGVMGIGGMKEGAKPPQSNFREAQVAPSKLKEFKGNVVAVQTAGFWDDDLDALQQRLERLNGRIDQVAKQNPAWTEDEKAEARRKAMAESFTSDELTRLKGISNGGYHYLGAAKILAPIGKAFADAVLHFTR
ncbi:MAG: sialate O-acetylesterase [Fimbriimonas sp.]|nr:sialate O-acetylesterase [Fimbriimonas sp.]